MDPPNSKRDILDWFFTYVNKTLLIFKLYYFFYFAAFGSLFPLISVYFKQLGFSPIQCGLVVGSRPFVEFISTPFWGAIAERWKRGKLLLIISIVGGLCFTIGIGVKTPEPDGCLIKGQSGNETIVEKLRDYSGEHEILVSDPKILYPQLIGQSPIQLTGRMVVNRISSDSEGLVIPDYSPIVYRSEAIYQTFVVILILMIFGEFVSAPSLSLVDTAVLNYLQDDRDNVGRQRMYGSVGWGLAMFFVGVALDNAVKFYHHPCGWPGKREKNYVICFAIFSVFMCFALITATQMTFCYENQSGNMYFKIVKDKVSKTIFGGKTKNREKLGEEYEEMTASDDRKDEEILERQLSIKLDKTRYKEKQTQEESFEQDFSINSFDLESWMGAFRSFRSVRLSSLLFLSWFMGFGVGIVFTFLFWHLQDIHGTPTLFGIASVINHISEILAYFFSERLILSLGHTKLLYLGLLGNVVRFLYVSWIRDAWWILPFEMLQGLTHAAVWSACFSYMAQSTSKEYRNASQRILHGVHNGLGKGCGSIFGGLIIGSYGSAVLFRAYGIACLFVLIGFLAVNYILSEIQLPSSKESNESQPIAKTDAQGPDFYSGYDQVADSKMYVGDSTFMSPHGIPGIRSNEYRSTDYNSMKATTNTDAFR